MKGNLSICAVLALVLLHGSGGQTVARPLQTVDTLRVVSAPPRATGGAGEADAAPVVSAGEEGFALRSADGQFSLRFQGGAQYDARFFPDDAGDVEVVPGDLHATHERVTAVTDAVLDLGLFPIALGGGHDLTFPFVRAVAQKHGPMDGVYFDPHLDVREHDGSGMPFRKLIETRAARSLRIHGFDPMSNSREHVRWFQSNGGRIDDLSSPKDPFPDGEVFVSLDMDVLDSAYAPGVSALNAQGWTPELAARWVAAAGANPRVRCFDIMECSPPHDAQGRTARLAARMLLTFLRAYSERPS